MGNRIVAELHLSREDYEDAIKTAKHGLQVLKQHQIDSGKNLTKWVTPSQFGRLNAKMASFFHSRMRMALQVILSTALIHFFSPKHHKEATRIVDEVLTVSPLNPAALMGRGFILQAASTWEGAMEAFDRVLESSEDDDERGMSLKANVAVLRSLRAREESAWCLCQLGRYEEASSGLETVSQRLDAGSGNEDNDDARADSDRARCFWRIGNCLLASESGSK